jgi:hypothetical protein
MSNDNEALHLVTPNNGVIPISILNSVRIEVARTVPTFDRGRTYRTEHVCVGIWDQLSKNEHKAAGRALKYLANNGMVPLLYTGRDGRNRALYMRTD